MSNPIDPSPSETLKTESWEVNLCINQVLFFLLIYFGINFIVSQLHWRKNIIDH